ncbi:shKT domain-containing protein [Caerostris extrusa]|uniref:ShKT domain-containing protein n=1 Tax=Caerostris extrusa TaxID=172846 RepID=A0AAV4N464_CAEEX|nr:shKT domain-containing protein [Caerostris extrusa]
MKMMEYNKTLEWAASEFLKLCKFEHGFAKSDNMTYNTGQNLYTGTSNYIDRYLYLFYMEYQNWDYVTQSCLTTPPGKKKLQCGHFTQVMGLLAARRLRSKELLLSEKIKKSCQLPLSSRR